MRLTITAILLSALAARAQAPPRVYIDKNEIFIDRDGSPVQLTRDGIGKSDPALSPDHSRILYATTCDQQHPQQCPPTIVILDQKGNRHATFPALIKDGPCNSVNGVEWIDSRRIGLDCHVNPSLSQYDEIDAESGRSRASWLGYWFTWSPDRVRVAHAGWIPHFAPPFAKSNYLQFGNTNVYPRSKPRPEGGLPEPPDVVKIKGDTYQGIHEFFFPLSWSPDSSRVALFECVYDWEPDAPNSNAGKQLNERYQLVIAAEKRDALMCAVTGSLARSWRDGMGFNPDDAQRFHLAWSDASTLQVSARGRTWTFEIGTAAIHPVARVAGSLSGSTP